MLLLLLTLLLIGYFIRRYILFRAQVNQVPGPPIQSVLMGNLNHFVKPKNMKKSEYIQKFFKHFFDIFQKYKKFGAFRLWIGPFNVVYILTNATSIENLLNSHVNVNKGQEYNFLKPWLGDGLLVSESAIWRNRRKLLVTGFHVKILQDFLPIFGANTNVLLKKISGQCRAESKKSVVVEDIRPLFENCTLDIVKETSFGLDTSQDSALNESYRLALKKAFFSASYRFKNPLHWFDCIYALTDRGKKFYESINFLSDYAENVINQRKHLFDEDEINNNNDSGIDDESEDRERSLDGRIIIDILMKKSAETGSGINPHVIKSEVNTFILGGHDTTAMALTFTTLMIGHHRDVQEKILVELEGIFEDNPTRTITMADLRQMRYLEQVIKETLRLYPSIQTVGRHLSEPLPLPNGTIIPTGSTVYVPILFLHRDPKYFPSPDEFIPERFAPENKLASQYAFIPFSSGPRNCIGQRYAMLELKYVLASILRQFQIRSKTKLEDIVKGISPVMKSLNSIEVEFERRDWNIDNEEDEFESNFGSTETV